MSLNTLQDLYIHQLKDMYSAEKQLGSALPTMVTAASDNGLKTAFQTHLGESEQHLEKVSMLLDKHSANPTSTKCKAMAGLIEEGSHIASESGNADAKDAALIVAAQKVEHYEIASYGSLHAIANSLGYSEDAVVLQSILDEEYAANGKLDKLALGTHKKPGLNKAAQHA
ncbi:MAG: ferritin-like domain-containing protein [Anaerolineales bacterium]|nr:ferritin-like domain-containing protein [Anaerolineales bacterium]MCB0006254.1 ferritin-like domain-containing protein [Anaerolineales bacterium]MCB0016610.1 ferritin-like domain-containing protein [Anaerolineales bacterium]